MPMAFCMDNISFFSLQLNYTFGDHGELSQKYEPHSDGEVMQLLFFFYCQISKCSLTVV